MPNPTEGYQHRRFRRNSHLAEKGLKNGSYNFDTSVSGAADTGLTDQESCQSTFHYRLSLLKQGYLKQNHASGNLSENLVPHSTLHPRSQPRFVDGVGHPRDKMIHLAVKPPRICACDINGIWQLCKPHGASTLICLAHRLTNCLKAITHLRNYA